MFDAASLVHRSLDLLPGEGGDALAHDLRRCEGTTKDGCRQNEGFGERIIALHIIGGIGFGIAIPHCSSDRLDKVVAAFGRSSTGIEFDALDNAPVKFVVLFIVPKNQFQTHLRTLASIAKFLNDRSVRDQLANATSADEIMSIFRARAQATA